MKTLLLLLLLAAPLAAQQPGRPGPEPRDPFSQYLIPPDLVMQRQEQIGLTDAQREAIKGELAKAQKTMTDVQWRIATEVGKLERLLQADVVDEARVLAQVDTMLAAEREIKRAQVMLMVRVRNTLTLEQRRQLQAGRPHGD